MLDLTSLVRVALIGSREAPERILQLCSMIGLRLSENGCVAHSGGARGCDNAFMRYYDPSRRKVYLPGYYFNGWNHNGQDFIALDSLEDFPRAIEEVKRVSDWETLSKRVRRLFLRNVAQVLGDDFKSPVEAVIYYAPVKRGYVQGGTRIAVNIAKNHGIPCFNLWEPLTLEHFEGILGVKHGLEEFM